MLLTKTHDTNRNSNVSSIKTLLTEVMMNDERNLMLSK